MKPKKRKSSYKQEVVKLKANHSWNAPKGYKIFIADRGAVSFNIPEKWFIAKFEPHLEIHDAKPPHDDARISVSFWKFPPGIDWTGLPLIPLLKQSIEGSEMEIIEEGEVISVARDDIEAVWIERKFIDPVEKRDAYTRILMARGFDVQVLITSDFWADDTKRLHPIWDEVVRSLQLGRVIEDPTKGPTLH
jgi:hypothetical protein